MNRWVILCLLACVYLSCSSDQTKVSDREKEEIKQLDSLLNDLANKKSIDKAIIENEMPGTLNEEKLKGR